MTRLLDMTLSFIGTIVVVTMRCLLAVFRGLNRVFNLPAIALITAAISIGIARSDDPKMTGWIILLMFAFAVVFRPDALYIALFRTRDSQDDD